MIPTADRVDSAPPTFIDRLSLVLAVFEGPGRLTLAQVTQRTGIPRSSTHRILEQLVMQRWLCRDGSKYELGTRLMELGAIAVRQNPIYNAALPVLHELHRVTGHLVHLGVLEGDDVLYLERVGGNVSSASHSRAGGRHPALSSPLGLALLAHSARASRELRDPKLMRVRDHGVAYIGTAQVRGIGVPIGQEGKAIAAISICAPADRLNLDHHAAAPVRIAANAIMRRLAGGPANIAPVLQSRDQLRSMPTARPRPRLQYV